MWTRSLLVVGAVLAACGATTMFALVWLDAGERDVASARAEALVVPPGREVAARRLLADVGFNRPLEGGFRFGSIRLDGSRVLVTLDASEHAAAAPAGELTMRPRGLAAPSEPTSVSFAIAAVAHGDSPLISRHLDAAVASVQAHDTGGFYIEAPDQPGAVGLIVRDGVRRAMLFAWGFLAALALVTLGVQRRRGRSAEVVWQFKLTHLLPALLQVIIYTYWGLYWSAVGEYGPIIVAQLAFAIPLDALLGVLVRGRWMASFGPIPIVLSTNLFLWFHGPETILGFLTIGLAVGSRHILRASGRHLFNPSGFAIAIIGVAAIAFPQAIRYDDLALQFNLPPNMTETILLVALIVQTRIPIISLSLGALAALELSELVGLFPNFGATWAPVFLVITLLATDPATSPRTPWGRVFFGLLLGVTMNACGTLLEANGISDFFGKVLPLPFLNFLVPRLDRAAERLPAWLRWPLQPRFNLLHLALWVSLVTAGLSYGTKAGGFEPALLVRHRVPLISADPQGQVTCAQNPVFCEPFSYLDELRLWRARDPATAPPPP